jgi:hypothetical protein
MSGLIGTSHSRSKIVGKSLDTAKAWCNFNGSGTLAIRDSFGVSSVTDNGTGNFTVNLLTAIADGNGVCVGTCNHDTGFCSVASCRFSSATEILCLTSNYNSTYVFSTQYDNSHVFVAVFG